MATVDFFLKIDGIAGESRDAKHKGEIDLEAFSWGATNQGAPGGGGGGGGGAGKVAMHDFHFTTRVNKASPLLFLSCATGKHLKQAILTARKAGKEQLEFLVYKFTDIMISSYQVAGSEGADAPMDQISFNFAQVEYQYREQKADGSPGSPIKAGWDVKKNKEL